MRRRRLAGQRQEIALQRLPLNLSLDTTTSSLPADQDSTVNTSVQLETSTEEFPEFTGISQGNFMSYHHEVK